MTLAAFGVTIFCDDIRHEINGKMTLVGCYSATLNFSGPPPGMLPTFAALVNLRFPYGSQFSSMILRVTKTEEAGTTDIFSVDAPITIDQIVEDTDIAQASGEEKVLSLVVPIQWSPLVFEAPALIRVIATMDTGQQVRAGSLHINFPSGNDISEN